MSGRWKAFIFLAALLIANLSFASSASAHTENVEVLHLTAVEVESNDVDVAPTGDQPSLGDYSAFSENLFRDGHKVGISGGTGRWRPARRRPACVTRRRLLPR
jgi:hypothetical protein